MTNKEWDKYIQLVAKSMPMTELYTSKFKEAGYHKKQLKIREKEVRLINKFTLGGKNE